MDGEGDDANWQWKSWRYPSCLRIIDDFLVCSISWEDEDGGTNGGMMESTKGCKSIDIDAAESMEECNIGSVGTLSKVEILAIEWWSKDKSKIGWGITKSVSEVNLECKDLDVKWKVFSWKMTSRKTKDEWVWRSTNLYPLMPIG